MQVRDAFAKAFREVLARHRVEGLTQRQLAGRIAQNINKDLARGPKREQAMRTAARRWEKQLSRWKAGDHRPQSQHELLQAIAVIDPGNERRWLLWWQQASRVDGRRTPRTVELMPAPSSPTALAAPSTPGRWRHDPQGAAFLWLSWLLEMGMHHPGYSAREQAEREDAARIPPRVGSPARIPVVRLAVVVAADQLSPDMSAAAVRVAFRRFLERSPASDLVAAMTHVDSEVSWRHWGRGSKDSVGAVLNRSDDDPVAPTAWSRLVLPQSGPLLGGRDGRHCGFVLYVEPRPLDGAGASKTPLSWWPARMSTALQVPEALARFLRDDLQMQTHDAPATAAGIRLLAPDQLIDIEDARRLPGDTPSPWFTGCAILDLHGESAGDIARRLVTQLADDAMHLDQYDHLLDRPSPARTDSPALATGPGGAVESIVEPAAEPAGASTPRPERLRRLCRALLEHTDAVKSATHEARYRIAGESDAARAARHQQVLNATEPAARGALIDLRLEAGTEDILRSYAAVQRYADSYLSAVALNAQSPGTIPYPDLNRDREMIPAAVMALEQAIQAYLIGTTSSTDPPSLKPASAERAAAERPLISHDQQVWSALKETLPQAFMTGQLPSWTPYRTDLPFFVPLEDFLHGWRDDPFRSFVDEHLQERLSRLISAVAQFLAAAAEHLDGVDSDSAGPVNLGIPGHHELPPGSTRKAVAVELEKARDEVLDAYRDLVRSVLMRDVASRS